MNFFKKTILTLTLLLLPLATQAQLNVTQGGTGKTSFSADQILYGVSSLRLGSEAAFTYDPTGNLLTFPNATGTILSLTTLCLNTCETTWPTASFDSTAVDATTWSDNANASNIWTFDVSGTDTTMTFASDLLTFSGSLTLATGKSFTIGSTAWNSGDSINGEVIANDTIDDDSIDFADVTLADLTFDVGSVSTTEFGFLNNVTSAIQTQLNAKEGTLTNEAGLYAALSDVTNFLQTGDSIAGDDITDGTVDSTEIQNDSLLAIDLNATNAETDDDIVTYDSGTGGFTFNSGPELCVAITGSAALCDGSDATGSGGSGSVATSTLDVDTYVTYFTSNSATPATIGGEAAFTYNDATNVLTVGSIANHIIGTDIQAWDTDLDIYAGITPSANVQSLLGAATYAGMRTQLDLEAGTDFYSISAADTAFEAELGNSAGLLAALSDEVGTGFSVFNSSPSITSPTFTSFFGTACTGNEFLQDIGDTGTFTCVEATGSGGGGSLSTTTDIIGLPGTVEDVNYITNDLLIGGSSSTTAEFQFDPEGASFTVASTSGTTGQITIAPGGLGTLTLGQAGVVFTEDGDGALTITGAGNGSDENLVLNLDDTANTGVFTSTTGLATLNFSSIALQESGINVLNNDEIDASAELLAIMDDETGTGALVFATSPTLVTPILGTPTSGNASNLTALNATQLTTGTVPAARVGASHIDTITEIASALKDGSGACTSGLLCLGGHTHAVSTEISGLGTGVATWLATPSSANLATAVTGETGSGALVFGTAPSFTTSITGSYLTASEMLITDGSKNIVSAPVATYPSLTELTYLKGVTSAIQTQINALGVIAGQVWTGVHDFGGAVIELTNGTAPTVDATGETAVDTTSDQFIYYGSATKRVLSFWDEKSMYIGSTTKDKASVGFNTGTSTYEMANYGRAVTLDNFYCKTDTEKQVYVRFGDGTNWTASIRCLSTGVAGTSLSNNTFTAREDIQVQVGTATSTNKVTITASFLTTAD